MTFLASLLVPLIEWALSKGLVAAEGKIAVWVEAYHAKQNAAAVVADAKAGNETALASDEQNLLDN